MPSTISPEEYLSVGKSEYKSKKYDEALESFTRGLENNSAPLTLTLLDARSATYEKLLDLKSALKDGRQMIKVLKNDARGYLRTGRVLQTMDKDETALNIYAMGLKNVDVKDAEFGLLHKLHNRLTLKLSPAKSIDPWTVLPVELVEIVIGYLGFRQMVRCLKVSKGWNRFLKNVPTLWFDLDLRFAKRPVSKRFVRSAILNSQRRIKSATLHRFADKDMLQALARTCKQLERLEFMDSTFTHDSVIDTVTLAKTLRKLQFGSQCEISTETIAQVLRHCPSLRELGADAFLESPYQTFWDYDLPHLESLILQGRSAPGLARMNLDSFLQRAKNLKRLELRGFHQRVSWRVRLESLIKLERFVLHPAILLFESLPPSLKFLEVDLRLSIPDTLEFALPSLTELHLHGNDISDLMANVERLTKEHSGGSTVNKTNLKRLVFELEGAENTSSALLAEDLYASRDLFNGVQEFGIVGLPMADGHFEVILSLLPNLTRLNLSHCKNITGVLVKTLVNGCTKLEHLNLDFCESISPDAIAWARGRGVEVSHAVAKPLQNGKRVRYGF